MDTQAVMDKLNTMVAFNKRAGIEVTELGGGRAKGRIQDQPENTNHLGDVAAGGIFALGELIPGAVLVAELKDEQPFMVVKRVEIDFLNTGRGELTAECVLTPENAELIQAYNKGEIKKFESKLNTTVKDKDNKDVASLVATYYIRRMSARLKAKTAG